jgi:hypothetical protein
VKNLILDLLGPLDSSEADKLHIIRWGAPIPAFGNPSSSKIATLGLNPSDKEFVDDRGQELADINRRFQTINSLGMGNWSEISHDQLQMLEDQCNDYFIRRPYDSWFKRLDFLISGTSLSYYFPSRGACHLDLVPYATSVKWGNLSSVQKFDLLTKYGDILGRILESSTIKVLVLNGKAVIDNLRKISDVSFTITKQPTWNLSRENTNNIRGYSYFGHVTRIGGIDLAKKIIILGFNHNIQSSFGVTTIVTQEIRNWLSEQTKEYL